MPKRRKPRRVQVVVRRLGRERALGLAWQGKDVIEVDPRLPAKRFLRVVCHELAHLAFPEASETRILRAERILGETLWRIGYRRIDQ